TGSPESAFPSSSLPVASTSPNANFKPLNRNTPSLQSYDRDTTTQRTQNHLCRSHRRSKQRIENRQTRHGMEQKDRQIDYRGDESPARDAARRNGFPHLEDRNTHQPNGGGRLMVAPLFLVIVAVLWSSLMFFAGYVSAKSHNE